MIKPQAFFHWKFHIRHLKSRPESTDMDQKYLTDSESLSLNIEATCLLHLSPRNFPYEIKMDKYRPYPSMISMFTSDSQHPPRSRHAVHLGENVVYGYDFVQSYGVWKFTIDAIWNQVKYARIMITRFIHCINTCWVHRKMFEYAA